MSTLQMFSVLDIKSEVFSAPLVAPTINAMARILGDVVAEGPHQYAKHPEDYVLFHLGEFDELSGIITLLPAPNSLFGLSTLKA